MRSRIALAVVVLAASLAAPPLAIAGEQLRPPVEGETLLAFGVPYASRVHHGVDLSAEEGEAVRVPSAGTVTFAGRLPGDEGGALGVTIQTADGLKVTCLPLASVKVARGESVEAGAKLGDVAAEGDASSGETHVHLSVRSGETYLDPAPLLAASPSAAQPDGPETTPAEGAEPAPASAAEPVTAGEAPPPQSAPTASGANAAPTAATASGVNAEPVAPVSAAPGAVASRLPAGASALRDVATRVLGRHAVSSPRRVPRISHAAGGGVLSALLARARSGAALVAEVLVALALLWPAWRRLSRPVELREAVPVRVRG